MIIIDRISNYDVLLFMKNTLLGGKSSKYDLTAQIS